MERIGAADSLGGVLNLFLPLVPLRRATVPHGAARLTAAIRLLAHALHGHPRNAEELKAGVSKRRKKEFDF